MAELNRYPSLDRSAEPAEPWPLDCCGPIFGPGTLTVEGPGTPPVLFVPVDVAADRLTDHLWPAADHNERERAERREEYRRVLEGAGP
jgi:hypothetical protein